MYRSHTCIHKQTAYITGIDQSVVYHKEMAAVSANSFSRTCWTDLYSFSMKILLW